MPDDKTEDLFAILAVYGSDFARWPAQSVVEARRTLLSEPRFRQAWERERDLDRMLSVWRGDVDAAVAAGGAARRVRDGALAALPAAGSIGVGWSRMAAAMLVACVLGGAVDLVLPERAAEIADATALDPVLALDEIALLEISPQ